MRNYVYSIRVLVVTTFISFAILFFVVDTSYDIMLAIFGSSFVSLIISIIGYITSRTDALEDFYRVVSERLHYWTLYDMSDDINKKCEYFMNYYIKEFSDIGRAYSRICFLFDCYHKNRNRIYYNLYEPCYHLNNTIIKNYWHFKFHIDGTGSNDEEIAESINEIENEMIDKDNGADIIIEIGKELNEFLVNLINNKKRKKYGDTSQKK